MKARRDEAGIVSARGILVAGGTGFIGSHLLPALLAAGDTVWLWSRSVPRARQRVPAGVRVIGDPAEIPPEAPVDAIVNLAGAPVVGPPWTASRRRELIESRLGPTRALLDWCTARSRRPEVMISASAIGFYGSGGETWLDERSPPTQEFQSMLCQQREAAAEAGATLGMRIVNLRFGLVLGADGGIFPPLARAARCGVAAVLGDGNQWMSWVHIGDALRVLVLALRESTLGGAVNVVAPQPQRQRDFQRALTRMLQRPLWLRIPAPLLRAMMGDMSELLVRSQRVTPRLLQDRGFEFRFPALEAALEDLVRPGRS